MNLGDFTTEQLQEELEMRNHPVCPFCGSRAATLLCDFLIGPKWSGELAPFHMAVTLSDGRLESRPAGKHYRVIDHDDPEMFTCDRPICRECAKYTGMFHASGKAGFTDTIDLCPHCAETREEFRERPSPVSKQEAEMIRAEMWKRSAGILQAL